MLTFQQKRAQEKAQLQQAREDKIGMVGILTIATAVLCSGMIFGPVL